MKSQFQIVFFAFAVLCLTQIVAASTPPSPHPGCDSAVRKLLEFIGDESRFEGDIKKLVRKLQTDPRGLTAEDVKSSPEEPSSLPRRWSGQGNTLSQRALIEQKYGKIQSETSGGQAVVLKTKEETTGRLHAVKVIAFRPGHLFRPLLTEGVFASAMSEADPDHFGKALYDEQLDAIIMDFLPADLSSEIARYGHQGAGLKATLSLLRSLADALESVHALGFVHRDVKPKNILLTETFEPRLTDFGYASIQGFQPAMVPDRMITGTPAHMSAAQIIAEPGAVIDDLAGLRQTAIQVLLGKVFPSVGGKHYVVRQFPGMSERYIDHRYSPHSMNKEVPAVMSAAVWHLPESLDQFRMLLNKASEAMDSGKSAEFFQNFYGPEILAKMEPQSASREIASSQELMDRLLSRKLGLPPEQEVDLTSRVLAIYSRKITGVLSPFALAPPPPLFAAKARLAWLLLRSKRRATSHSRTGE